MSLEIKGKVSAYSTNDGIQLNFMEYSDKLEVAITEDWYGQYKNILFDIYKKFGTKPVVITIDKAE